MPFLRRVACSRPCRPLLEQIPFAPDPASLDLLMAPLDLRTGSGRRLRFVPPPADGLDYEMRIWARGEVATRPDNWHDFFNALVWCTFPLAKAALNARHAAALTAQAGIRGSDRDALTHFDECGVVVVASDPSLLALLRGFQWRALFWTRRHDLARALRCFVFGHATYEHLLRPFRGLTAKAGALRSDCGLAVPSIVRGNCRISTGAWPASSRLASTCARAPCTRCR
jgi:hypothetical protein